MKAKISRAVKLFVVLPVLCLFVAFTLFHYMLIAGNHVDRYVVSTANATVDFTVEKLASSRGFERPKLVQPEEKLSAEQYLCKVGILYGLSCDVLLAQKHIESRGDVWARSEAGAMGYMQLMPATAKACHMKEAGEAYVVESNIDCGVWWLKKGIEEEGGDLARGLQRYHGGPKCVGNPGCPKTLAYSRNIINFLAGTKPKKG